jgi:hypothetical protein
MYVHRYDRTFTGRIAIWERPIAYFMFEHVCTISENQCQSLTVHVSYCWRLWGGEWWSNYAHLGLTWVACYQILHVGEAHSVFHTTCAVNRPIRVIRLGAFFFLLNIWLEWCLYECMFLPNPSMYNTDRMRRRATCSQVSDNRNTFLVRTRCEVRLTKNLRW